ncbi:MAG: Sir2 family NAD-dependent protein deacetylase [Thermoanaerobaculia bacterium]|jgi:NAD-dependent deacetylase
MKAIETPELARLVGEVGTGHLVILTGAGVSAASGLPLFRGPDPDAIWSRDVTEMGTNEAFVRDPVYWWRWFISRFGGLRDAKPNEAHRAIAELERWHRARGGKFTLITQNVDTLHEDAGSHTPVKVHGTIARWRCSRHGCQHGAPWGSLPLDAFDALRRFANPREETLPRCPSCRSLVRAHVLLFDEYYAEHDDYGFPRATSAFESMELLLLVGTSLSVGITDMAVHSAASKRIPAIRIDPRAETNGFTWLLKGEAETVLPELVGDLERRAIPSNEP